MKFELVITDIDGKKKRIDLWKVYPSRKRKQRFKELVEDLGKMKVDIQKEMLHFCQWEMERAFRKICWYSGRFY